MFRFLVITSSQTEKKLVSRVRKVAKLATKCISPQQKKKILNKRKSPFEIQIAFISEKEIRDLNRRYRGKNRPTDVLSFETPSPSSEIGQLAISWKIISRQAEELGIPEHEELERMVVHGILHLFGYEHEKSKLQAKAMFSLQENILSKLRVNVRGGQFLE